MALPADPLVTGASIAAWLDVTPPVEGDDPGDPDQLEELAAAVDLVVRGLPSTVKLFDGKETWDARWIRGAKMWGGRLHRRRLSPEGVYQLAGDAVAYVNRNDPDVAMLLRLNMPMVG